ncbi:hypothetical protein ACHOLT_10325 [Desulfitobacterium sp. Sab5]|uniref:hypothetical protein n=1 Tax=Desulfitobacterium nosdiversum TaxID=3375356 RepID=UPI003CF8A2C3
MSSGIFGPRAPSYPLPPTFNSALQPSYQVPAPNPYSYRYSAFPQQVPSYNFNSAYPCTTIPQPGYSQFYPQTGYSYSHVPVQQQVFVPDYSVYSNAFYSQRLQYGVGISSRGLETILIAILILVSLDLIFVRPLKGY